ncbi:MAG: hypothetical protein JJ935_09940 [Muricauda sp.]|nr:hypothetical protein [Allomuricauda sp.]MBO6589427.1 hypothetical protein [Allomuricauda sp.]MBO6644964.1 hypothetical protein [Allomuricauda sp.]
MHRLKEQAQLNLFSPGFLIRTTVIMKHFLNIFLLLAIYAASPVKAQDSDNVPNNKAVVYFVRAKSMGSLVNFTYFDGERAIGKFNGRKYLRYECDPGEHLFWARSENRSFVEANLAGGKTYMIEALPRMGGLKAAVKLVPVDIESHNMKKIIKLFSKKDMVQFTEEEIAELQKEMTEVIVRGMERYQQGKEEGEEMAKLMPKMTIDISTIRTSPK